MHFDRPFLFDGAFGTYYFSKTGDEAPCELANLTAPQTVLDIHREYAASGCAALKTNTFAANPVSIPDSVRLNEVIAAGWSLAQHAAQENGARVFADIGGICADTAEADYLTVVRHFLELGAQNFLFETLACYQDVQRAVGLIRQSVPDATVIVSFAVSQDGYSRRGLYCRALFDQAESDPQVDAVGLNCSCGPSHMRSLLRALGQRVKPVAAMPNAGYPSSLNGRVFFEDNAGYFAQQLSALYMDGADILGGCCGTTPQHIRCAAAALAAAAARPKGTGQPKPQAASAAGAGAPGGGRQYK